MTFAFWPKHKLPNGLGLVHVYAPVYVMLWRKNTLYCHHLVHLIHSDFIAHHATQKNFLSRCLSCWNVCIETSFNEWLRAFFFLVEWSHFSHWQKTIFSFAAVPCSASIHWIHLIAHVCYSNNSSSSENKNILQMWQETKWEAANEIFFTLKETNIQYCYFTQAYIV